MEFNTRELQNAIGKLKGIIKSKSPYPAIRGVLYKDGTFSATDMNVHASVGVTTGLVPTDEKFIIPAIAFDAIGKLSAPQTTITPIEADQINIRAGKFDTIFTTPNVEDFPHFDNIGDELVRVGLTLKEFTNCINGVFYAVSTDEKKGNLCGVNIATTGVGINFTALDGFRAARTQLDYNNLSQFSSTVPDGFWKALNKIGAEEEKVTLSISADGKTVAVRGEEFEVLSRTFDGSFVDVDRIINGINPDKNVIVVREELLQALDLHSAAVKDEGKNNLIVLDIDPDAEVIKFSAKSASSNFTYEIGAECNGFTEPFRIGFNGKYLGDAVRSMFCEDVKIAVKAATAGALISDADKPHNVALVLPVRIN